MHFAPPTPSLDLPCAVPNFMAIHGNTRPTRIHGIFHRLTMGPPGFALGQGSRWGREDSRWVCGDSRWVCGDSRWVCGDSRWVCGDSRWVLEASQILTCRYRQREPLALEGSIQSESLTQAVLRCSEI